MDKHRSPVGERGLKSKYTAIYARQSIEKKDSLSIEGQIELCRKECPDDEVRIYEDRGYSGKNTRRPAFEQLMKDVAFGQIGRLVCYRLDRISRNIADFSRIWEVLEKHGVAFSSVNERFDTSSSIGKAMLYIIMIFAQMEREAIAERVKDNYYQRLKKGAWPGGPAPYGFVIARSAGTCILEPTENIEVVKEIYTLYNRSGSSLRSVGKILNERGIPSARRAIWDSVALARLLRQPAYVRADVDIYYYYKSRGAIIGSDLDAFTGVHGALLIGKRTNNERKYTDVSEHLLVVSAHAGVVDSKVFLACQHKLDGNKQIKNTGKGKHTWLSGLLKCGVCGYSLKVLKDAKTGRRYLACSGRTQYAICDHRHAERLDDIECYVAEEMQRKLALMRSHQSSQHVKAAQRESRIKLEVAKTEQQITHLVNAMSEGSAVTMKYINAQLEILDREKNLLINQLATSDSTLPLEMLFLNLREIENDTLKNLAFIMIERIHCTADETKIIWSV